MMIFASLSVLLLACSCALPFGEGVSSTLLIIDDERIEEAGYEFHVLLYDRRTARNAIIIIPGELDDQGFDLIGAAGSQDQAGLEAQIGSLLGIDIHHTVFADTTEAQVLFTILDSLEAFDLEGESVYGDVYSLRWDSLYRHAALLSSDQVISKVLDVTDGQIAASRVRAVLKELGSSTNEPYLIHYPIDMYHRPLYKGAYGKELVSAILRRLEEPQGEATVR